MARFAHVALSAALLASAVGAGAWSVSSPTAALPPCRRLRAAGALRASPSPRSAARPLGALRASSSSPSEGAVLADRLMGLQLPVEVRLCRLGLCARAASAADRYRRRVLEAEADVQQADKRTRSRPPSTRLKRLCDTSSRDCNATISLSPIRDCAGFSERCAA